jgi:hypothetical protein
MQGTGKKKATKEFWKPLQTWPQNMDLLMQQ